MRQQFTDGQQITKQRVEAIIQHNEYCKIENSTERNCVDKQKAEQIKEKIDSIQLIDIHKFLGRILHKSSGAYRNAKPPEEQDFQLNKAKFRNAL